MTMSTPIKPERLLSEPVGRRILSPDQVDDLGEAVLVLAREIYVLSDRQMLLEAILTQQGVDLSELEHFEPPPELQARIDAKRDAIVLNVLRALKAAD